MIESIRIKGVPHFSENPEELDGLSKINFLYGPNGSGKTTISRLIADEDRFQSCDVRWKNESPLQTFVYNSDFVKENFSREEIKGIFTLGKDDIGIKEEIENIQKEIAVLDKTVSGLEIARKGENGDGGKERELEELESEFKDKCWEKKTKLDDCFKAAFAGYRDKKEKFKNKVLEESDSNAAELKPLDHLEQKAETIFKDGLSEIDPVPSIQKAAVLDHEKNPVLGKKIIGREDVDIGAMIRRLGNSDWVGAGRVYFDGETCPFCQQKTPEAFAESLNEYFDETFEKDMAALGGLADSYEADSEEIRGQIRSVMKSGPGFLDVGAMETKKAALERILEENAGRIEEKKNHPSLEAALETAADVIAGMEDLIKEANADISGHNESVRNLDRERKELTGQVWKYIVEEELKDSISGYRKRGDKLTGDIGGIKEEIRFKRREMEEKGRRIRELERERTSIQRTVDEINSTLSSVGFGSFRLAKTEAGDFYRVVREGGENAKETLSEGEERFVTFLYFYHLLKGSQSGDGTASDCVAVFDDPVSSLDGEMLFVISNLIKGVFKEIGGGEGNIRQAFVLTHNVYFHKEITYGSKKKGSTFWIVRKSKPQGKKLKKSESNPIKTSYELLWVDVRNDERPCSGTLQNTMRRILEYYFEILGGVDKDDICGKFDGERKTICKSLFSWAHAGSHYVDEDLYVSMSHSDELYREVFREIFEKSGHIAHYDMMTGKSSS